MPHAEEVAYVEPPEPGLGTGKVSCQFRNNGISPLGCREFGTDHLTHLPVQLDERRIDGLIGALLGRCDKYNHFRE